MKKRFCFLVCTGLCYMILLSPVRAQVISPIDDAIKISQVKKSAGRDSIPISFFTKYGFQANMDADSTDDALLNDILPPSEMDVVNKLSKRSRGGLGVDFADPDLNFDIGTLTGLDITTFADGLAQFLVERTKEELEIAFFRRIQKVVDSSEVMGTLFPNTQTMLSTMGADIWDFKDYLSEVREAFEEDLENLPEGLQDFVEPYKEKAPRIVASLQEALRIGDWLATGLHPGEVLNLIASNPFDGNNLNVIATNKLNGFSTEDSNLCNSVRAINLISQSLRTNEGNGRYWRPVSDLTQMDATAWKAYLLLLANRCDSLNPPVRFRFGTDSIYFSKTLRDAAGNLNTLMQFKALVTEFAAHAEQIETEIAQIKQALSETKLPDWKSISGLLDHATELVGHSREVYHYLAPKVGSLNIARHKSKLDSANHVIRKLTALADLGTEIATDVQQGKYSSAVANLVIVLKTCFPHDSTSTAMQQVLRYGGFFAALAEADSAAEVKKVIEAFAMPAGSSIIKKESSLNLAVQAYVGLNWLATADPANYARLAGKLGVYAPVGISFSKGFSFPNPRVRWSLTAFASLIDVGAIVQYRFSETDSAIKAKITPAKIFSPGLNFALGLPEVPITLGVGWQANSLIAYDSDSNNVVDDATMQRNWGFHCFVAVDIPLLNLGTRARSQGVKVNRKGVITDFDSKQRRPIKAVY